MTSPERHARIKEIFLAARERPPEERDELVARRCAGDEELEREVHSLLLHLQEDGDTARADDAPQALLLGRRAETTPTVAGYRILQKLGEGGMGEVYEAEQLAPVRRRVALKVLKGGLATREILARFESERQALAMMNHPNIAQVFEAGVTDREQPFFAMELVHGEPVTDYCDRHRLTNRDRLALFTAVCAGVQHAHQKGVIHRDLKPSNILVTVDDGRAVPKIIDFGVAKATAQRLTEQTLFTRIGQWIGTPEYMSPEQAEMTGLDIDTRSDVYSLGVLLYELLAGARPFDSRALRQAGFDEIRRRIREDEPTRPSTRVSSLGDGSQLAARHRQTDVTSLVQQLRGDLDWITLKAMEKDRTRRYGSPSELAADIRRHLDDEPVVACPPSTVYKLGKFVRRNRLAVLAGGLVLGSLLLGLVMAGSALVHARSEARRANQVAAFLENLLADFNPFLNRTAVSTESLLDAAVGRMEIELAGQDLVQARLLQRIGVAYKDLGAFERARQVLDRSQELFEAEVGREHPEVASSLNELAMLAWETGDYPRHHRLQTETVNIGRATLDADDPQLLWHEMDLAFSLWALGEFDQSEELYMRVLAAQERTLGPDHLDVARNLLLQGVLFNSSGDYARAREAAERSRSLRSAILGPENVHVGWSLRTLARAQHQAGDFAKALESGKRALELLEAALGPEHSDLAFALATLGETYRDLGDFKEARRLLQRSLALRESALGPDHLEVSLSLIGLGWLQLEAGDLDAAAVTLERALAIDRRGLPAGHPRIAWRLHALSSQRRASGRRDEALAMQKEALAILEEARGPEHPALGAHLANLGSVLRDMGNLAGARESLERGLSRMETQLGPDHLRLAYVHHELALLHGASGEPDLASRRFERALRIYEATVRGPHPELARCLRGYAGHLRRRGDAAGATGADRRAAAIEAGRLE